MSMGEVLRKVKDAEETADAAITAAKDEASRILQNARKEAQEIIQSSQDDSISNTQKVLDDARSSAGVDADKVKDEGSKVISSLKSSAEQRRTDAVKHVVASLLND